MPVTEKDLASFERSNPALLEKDDILQLTGEIRRLQTEVATYQDREAKWKRLVGAFDSSRYPWHLLELCEYQRLRDELIPENPRPRGS